MLIFIACALLALSGMHVAAFAAEPRPWLCRDKPVFSADKPMVYEAHSRSGRSWQIIMMQFEPGTGHDGFDVMSSHRLTKPTSDNLPAGRYYVVAMHLSGGRWVCHGDSDTSYPAGTVARICFDQDDSSSCRVKLTVKESSGSGSSAATSVGAARAP